MHPMNFDVFKVTWLVVSWNTQLNQNVSIILWFEAGWFNVITEGAIWYPLKNP